MKLLLPFAAVVMALIWAARVDDAPAEADLVIANRSDVFTLDPQRMSYLNDFRLAYALYEGLVRWDPVTYAPTPAAAESLPDISEDGLTYTFRIRNDAKWSNGDPVTAYDYAYAWLRLLLPETAADYSNLFFDIEGAQAFWAFRRDQLARFESASQAQALANYDEAIERFHDSVGITVVDQRTIQVTLRRPVPYFLDLMCFAVVSPVHRPSVEGWQLDEQDRTRLRERGWRESDAPEFDQRRFVRLDPATGRFEQDHGWARPGLLVSNGPYLLDAWRYKRDLRLERNPFYHDQALAQSDSIVLRVIEDANTRVLAFETGEVDLVTTVGAEYQADMLAQKQAYIDRHREAYEDAVAGGSSPDEALAALPDPERHERRNIKALPSFGTDFFSFNCRTSLADGRANPFADARVRRAFSMAISREAIVERITRLNEPVMTTLIPHDSIPGYHNPAGLPEDRLRAIESLESAGWSDRDGDGLIENETGESFPIIDLLYTTNSPRYKWMSLELKAQWEQALGVRVELRGADTKFYKEDLKNGAFMIARGRWYGDYGDPTTFLDLCRSTDGNNDRGFASPRIDAMLDAASLESDPQERLELLAECERVLFTEDLPMAPICQLVELYLYEPGELEGLSTHPRLTQYLFRLKSSRHTP